MVFEGSDMIGRKGYHSNWIIDVMQRNQRPILLQSVQKGCLVYKVLDQRRRGNLQKKSSRKMASRVKIPH